MNYRKRIVSTCDIFPMIREILDNGHKARFTVSGNSMRPWIIDNRDQVLVTGVNGRKLKNGDIILYLNKHNKYILHRIYKRESEGYRTIGDSCTLEDDELVLQSDVIGIVEKIYRKGKELDCSSLLWRLLFTTWRLLLPIREEILRIYIILAQAKNRL